MTAPGSLARMVARGFCRKPTRKSTKPKKKAKRTKSKCNRKSYKSCRKSTQSCKWIKSNGSRAGYCKRRRRSKK